MNIPITKKIIINNKTKYTFPDSIFEIVWEIVAEKENIKENSFIDLLLTNNEIIRKMNKDFRGKDSVTDVLSFTSNLVFTTFLGDIIINVDAALIQKGKNSLEQELQKLFLHGLLHLSGYDHLSFKKKEIMDKKENEYWILLQNY